VFLDRDGVINRRLPGEYVRAWEQFRFLPGARAGMRLLKAAGYLLVVVTNQRGIARRLMSEADLAAVHGRMRAELERAGASVDAIYHCPHEIAEACGCRKPQPGMLLRAIAELEIDPARSWIVGDSLSDLEAGSAAGVPGVLVAGRGGPRPDGVRTAGSLLVAARRIAGGADGG
jgi:D-glycero-D-manno-heptose 1,7-bisphosphate phosphatase